MKTIRSKENLLVQVWQNRKARIGILIIGFFAIFGIIGKIHTPYPASFDNFPSWLPPSAKHWFGTDYDGHDVFSQFMYGTGVSLYVGAAVAIIAVSLGTIAGLVSGYYGGLIDNALMRFVDILLILPTFPLLVILSTYFKPTVTSTIIVIGILSWRDMAYVFDLLFQKLQRILLSGFQYVLSCSARPVQVGFLLQEVVHLLECLCFQGCNCLSSP